MDTLNRTRLYCTLLAAVAAAVTTAAVPARADNLHETRSVTVNYADLDLSKPAGILTLYRRLQAAARAVCRPVQIHDVRRRQAWRNCYETSVANAVHSVNVSALLALHRNDIARQKRG